jgi:hypothetical protein
LDRFDKRLRLIQINRKVLDMFKHSLLISALLFYSMSIEAGSTCKYDWKGDYVCNWDDGYSTNTKRDWKGDDVTTDNYGNTQTCKTDWKGDYVCN